MFTAADERLVPSRLGPRARSTVQGERECLEPISLNNRSNDFFSNPTPSDAAPSIVMDSPKCQRDRKASVSLTRVRRRGVHTINPPPHDQYHPITVI